MTPRQYALADKHLGTIVLSHPSGSEAAMNRLSTMTMIILGVRLARPPAPEGHDS